MIHLIEFFLDIWALLSVMCVDILLTMIFLILLVCLVIRNNSFGNSWSWSFFFLIVNIVSFIFFAADKTFFTTKKFKLVVNFIYNIRL